MEHAMKVFMIGFRVKYMASQTQDLWTVDMTATQLCVTLVRSLSCADLRLLAFKTRVWLNAERYWPVLAFCSNVLI